MESLLAGHSTLERVVAVHQLNDQSIRLYQRLDGKILQTEAEFFPFFFLADPSLLDGYAHPCWKKELDGPHAFRTLVAFDRWSAMWDAIRHLLARHRAASGRAADSYADVDALFLRPDPVVQFLLHSGVTHYRHLPFAECVRLQIQIATLASAGPVSKASRSGDRIVFIGLSDTAGWKTVLGGINVPEPQLLEQFVAAVQERDPDILEGFQLIGHTLPYLLRRAELMGKELGLGRDGSEPRRAGALTAEGIREGEGWGFDVAGRAVVDVTVLAQMQDTLRRSFETLDLPALASVFAPREKNLGPEPAVVADTRSRTLSSAQRRLEAELRVVRNVSKELLPPYLALCTMCPLPLSTLLRTGSSLRAELIILREYIRRKHSIPRPSAAIPATALPSEMLTGGLFSDVLYAGIGSLLPTIARLRSLSPRDDTLGAIPRLLSGLSALDTSTHHPLHSPVREAEALLLDSCSSLLFSGKAMFADAGMATQLSAEAQTVLTELTRTVELHNGLVIEYDTDGIYLVPPDNVRGPEQQEFFVRRLSERLPEGLRFSRTVHYPCMLAYRRRNHAVLTMHGQLMIRGPSMLPHTLEPFFRRFLRQAILLIMREDFLGLHTLYAAAVRTITNHQWTIADFARSETAHESSESYSRAVKAGTRKPSPAHQAAERGNLYYQPGDRIRYYIAGSGTGDRISDHSRLAEEWDPHFPDDSTAYYRSRLDETAARLAGFFTGEDFRTIFAEGELFEFDPSKITLQRPPPPSDEDHTPPARHAGAEPSFGIWLDEEAL